MSRELKVGIGASEATSAAEAGATAATEAIEALGDERAALVIVLATVAYDLPDLLAGIRGVTGDVPLVGATTCGALQRGSFVPRGAGVEILALTAGSYRFGVAAVEGVMEDPEAVGQSLVRDARHDAYHDAAEDLPPHAALLMFTDGLAGNEQRVINGIYSVTGASVPVVGASAGDDRRLTGTFVFHNERILHNATVGVWIGSEQPLRVVCQHGWRPLGLPAMITEVDGTYVKEIGGRPAMDVYRDRIGEPLVDLEPDQWSSMMASHPLGLIEPDGTHVIRATRVSGDNDKIVTFSPMPVFAAVNVMTAAPDELLAIVEPLVNDALCDRQAGVLLVFSCSGRHEVLGDRVKEEAALLQASAGSVPTFGFYTYGEIARTNSVAGHHNATISAIAL